MLKWYQSGSMQNFDAIAVANAGFKQWADECIFIPLSIDDNPMHEDFDKRRFRYWLAVWRHQDMTYCLMLIYRQ